MNGGVMGLKGAAEGRVAALGRQTRGGASLAVVFATAHVEVRQTLSSPVFWVLQVVLLTSGLLVLAEESAGGAYLRYASAQVRQYTAFNWLLFILFVWPALLRVRGSRGDLAFSAPVTSFGLSLGTLLGCLTWLAPATYAQFAIRWLLGAAVGGQANWTLLTSAPLLALASMLVALGLVACLSLVLPRLLPALLVWLGLWVFLLQHAGGLFGGFAGPFMPLFDPLNVFFEGLMLSPAVGLGLMQSLVVALALMYASVGVLLMGAWLRLLPMLDGRRADAWRLARNAALVLIVGLSAWAGMAYRWEVREQQPPESPLDIQLDEWVVVASAAELEFEPASRSRPIRGTHLLEVAPRSEAWPEKLVLRVNPGINVTARVDSATLSSERQGDSVVVDIGDVPPFANASLALRIDFEGKPFWPYADHRFRQGGSFPAIDSSQPITSLATNGVGYLLRGGDWLPSPWSSQPHETDLAQRLTVVTIDSSGASSVTFDGSIPQLVALVAPPERPVADDVADVRAHVGRDAGAGLIRALANIARHQEKAWTALGESGEPRLVAMPYLPDAYSDGSTIVIPESYDLTSSHAIGGAYRASSTEQVEERAALQLLARAWLNGHVNSPRGYAQAQSYTSGLRLSTPRFRPEPQGNRWLQVEPMGPVAMTWSPNWIGYNSQPYDVTPFALWLGLELASAEVRATDLELLRSIDGRERNYFDLSGRLLPWGLIRNPEHMSILLGLAKWTEEVGRTYAVELFTRVYRSVDDQGHAAVLSALEVVSGISILEGQARFESAVSAERNADVDTAEGKVE